MSTEESYRDKLRRLRRELKSESAAPEPQRRAGAGMPGWLRDKLDRQREGAGEEARPQPEAAHREPSPWIAPEGSERLRTEGEPRDLEVRTRAEGVFAERVILRPDADEHGSWRLDQVDGAEHLERLARDRALAGMDPRRAVYLDIETTGLSGGAGTWPFMVALGRFTEDGSFELWQGFLREPGEERAMLAEVAERVAAADAVVSFFGKAFDKTRLEDKLRQHRLASPFADRPHLDLYHPLNRLYCRRSQWDRLAPTTSRRGPARSPGPAPSGVGFADGRLGTMERELCGLQRIEDLSGAFAPAAWFDFLARRPHLLERVFDHNADDVWSLVTLTAHLGRSFDEADPRGGLLSGPAVARALGLASLARDEGARDEERRWLERARERLDAVDEPRGLTLWRADAARLAGDKAGALELYDWLAREVDAHSPRLHVERAKLLEHHAKDPTAALAACESARAAAVRFLGSRTAIRFLADLDHRAERLRGKLAAREG